MEVNEKMEQYRVTLAYARLLLANIASLNQDSQGIKEVYVRSDFDLVPSVEEKEVVLIGPHVSGAASPRKPFSDELPCEPPAELLIDSLHTLVFRMSCRYQQLLKRV